MKNILREYFLQGFNSDLGADFDPEEVKNSVPSSDDNLVGLCCYCYVAGRYLKRYYPDEIQDEDHAERIFYEFSTLVLHTHSEKGILRNCSELFGLDNPYCEISFFGSESVRESDPTEVGFADFYNMVRKLVDDVNYKRDLLYDVLHEVGAYLVFRATFDPVGTFCFTTDWGIGNEFYRSEVKDDDLSAVDMFVDQAYQDAGNLYWVYRILYWLSPCEKMAEFNFESTVDQQGDCNI